MLGHLDRLLCCDLAVYFSLQSLNIFEGHYPLWNPIHFSDGEMKLLNVLT